MNCNVEIAIASDVGDGEYYDDVAPEKIAEVACANDRALIAFPSAVGALIENKNITSSIGHDFCMHDDLKAFRVWPHKVDSCHSVCRVEREDAIVASKLRLCRMGNLNDK